MSEKYHYKKFLLSLIGIFILVLGITLTLAWWQDFMHVLKGISGFILSLAGLLMLYSLKR